MVGTHHFGWCAIETFGNQGDQLFLILVADGDQLFFEGFVVSIVLKYNVLFVILLVRGLIANLFGFLPNCIQDIRVCINVPASCCKLNRSSFQEKLWCFTNMTHTSQILTRPVLQKVNHVFLKLHLHLVEERYIIIVHQFCLFGSICLWVVGICFLPPSLSLSYHF